MPDDKDTPYAGREVSNADLMVTLSMMRKEAADQDRTKMDLLTRLEKHITGGDDPEKGLIVRMAMQEKKTDDYENVKTRVNEMDTQIKSATRFVRWASGTGGAAGLAALLKAWVFSGNPPSSPPGH